MKRTFTLLFAVVMVFGLAVQADAALFLRGTDSQGNQLIYDDDFDITWYDYTSDGGTWLHELEWADDALIVNFGGMIYDDWRLPTAFNRDGTGPCFGYDCIESEMGHLYYTELGNPHDVGSGMNMNFIDGDTGLEESFLNLRATYMYWLAEEYTDDDALLFSFDYGIQNSTTKNAWCVALAVRPGDVHVSPTAEEQIEAIQEFFDEMVTSGDLAGLGATETAAAGKLNALDNMLAEAEYLIDSGYIEEACIQLNAVYMKTDGAIPPPDFVTGDAAAELAAQILTLMDTLGCE